MVRVPDAFLILFVAVVAVESFNVNGWSTSSEPSSSSESVGTLRETDLARVWDAEGGLVGLVDGRDLDAVVVVAVEGGGLVDVDLPRGFDGWSKKKGHGRPDLASRLRCSSL